MKKKYAHDNLCYSGKWQATRSDDPLGALFADAGTYLENDNGSFNNMLIEQIFERPNRLHAYCPCKKKSNITY